MNITHEGSRYYRLESFWRPKKEVQKLDYNDKPYPHPDERKDPEWYDRKHFLGKLIQVEKYVQSQQRVIYEEKEFICIYDQEKLGKMIFIMNGMMWRNDLKHYIREHQIKPSNEFIERIFMVSPYPAKQKMMVPKQIVERSGLKYLRIDTNQLMIMDALMEHGGGKKKYLHREGEPARYSEHSGLLDFDNKTLEKIVVSGRTTRTDTYDKDIFLPTNMESAKDFEYIFHTHPPTPTPGGRARQGILFEFPSLSDIFHFMEHYESGITQGSIVIAPEGLYNIRKHNFDGKPIVLDEKKFFNEALKVYREVQAKALNKFGYRFTLEEYYTKIVKDRSYIEEINQMLNRYDLQIDYYPRHKDRAGNWVIRTLYLPVFPYEFLA